MTFIRPTDDFHSADLVKRLRTQSSVRSWEEADKQRAEAADRIEQLERENKELRRDAERFRHLRPLVGEELIAAIDAAKKEQA